MRIKQNTQKNNPSTVTFNNNTETNRSKLGMFSENIYV